MQHAIIVKNGDRPTGLQCWCCGWLSLTKLTRLRPGARGMVELECTRCRTRQLHHKKRDKRLRKQRLVPLLR